MAAGKAALGSAVATPPGVLRALKAAFGEALVGETGYDLAASRCTSEEEKADARERGSSLLYGELLPDGVSKALLPEELGGGLPKSNGVFLELGMGSGKVALQVFLQCPQIRRVVGVEIAKSRYTIAEAALEQLVASGSTSGAPALRVASRKQGQELCVADVRGDRQMELHCADFFSIGLHLVEETDAIFFAVQIPSRLFPRLCERLAKAKEGCRLFTYHALSSIWWTNEPCPWHTVDANRPETDMFSTSWSPSGYKFHVYECNRKIEPEIKTDPLNETYSQWQAVWDEASKSYYYHNQETEVAQWEVPHEVGCWHACWAEEHKAYFFFHEPTSHSQWEVPKCMADLGWVAT